MAIRRIRREYSQADVGHRMEMVRLAIQNVPYLTVVRSGAVCKRVIIIRLKRCHVLNSTYPEVISFTLLWGQIPCLILKTGKSLQLFAESVFCWQQPGIIAERKKFSSRIEELKEKYDADIRILNTPNMDVASEAIRRKDSAERRYCRDGS